MNPGRTKVGRCHLNDVGGTLLGVGSERVKPLFIQGDGDVQCVRSGILIPPRRRHQHLSRVHVFVDGRHERRADDDKYEKRGDLPGKSPAHSAAPTVSVPFMFGWSVQKYSYSPGKSKAIVAVSPGRRMPVPQVPASSVAS